MHRLVSTLWLDLNWAWTFVLGCFGTMARCTSRSFSEDPEGAGGGGAAVNMSLHTAWYSVTWAAVASFIFMFSLGFDSDFPYSFSFVQYIVTEHPLLSVKHCTVQFSSVQFSSVAQSCRTLCNSMNCSTPGLPVHHQLPEFTQTHVHWVGDAVQPSHPLSSPSLPAPNPSQHQGLFQCTVHGTRPLKSLWPSAETVRLLMEDPDSGFTISDLMSSWWRQLVKNQCVLHQANKNK